MHKRNDESMNDTLKKNERASESDRRPSESYQGSTGSISGEPREDRDRSGEEVERERVSDSSRREH